MRHAVIIYRIYLLHYSEFTFNIMLEKFCSVISHLTTENFADNYFIRLEDSLCNISFLCYNFVSALANPNRFLGAVWGPSLTYAEQEE